MTEPQPEATLIAQPRSGRRSMNQELKAKWLEALRSGKYPQGKEELRTKDGFCCLGVLCDIAGVEWLTLSTSADPDNPKQIAKDKEGTLAQFYLTLAIRREAGLTAVEEEELIKRNDAGVSFREIADYIESNL